MDSKCLRVADAVEVRPLAKVDHAYDMSKPPLEGVEAREG